MIDLSSFIQRGEALRVLGVKVSQHGQLVGEHLWEDDVRRNVYSASKTYTAMAVGIAQAEGLLSIDERLTDAFPEDMPETVSPHLASATVRDLLTMGLGQEKPCLMGADRIRMTETDWIRFCLAQPFSDAPGSRFLYSNAGPYLAGLLVQRRAGCSLVEYLMPRLFVPLGYHLPTWEADPRGYNFGAGGLMLPLKDLHAFGQLLLQGGAWEGRQLIPSAWVRACMSRQMENGTPWGYGYLCWGGPAGSFRADGKYGQLTIVLREQDAVISTFAECRQAGLLDAVFETIVPQL